MSNQQPSTELVAELNKATISGLEDACELLRERIEELENALRKGLLMLSYQDGPAERPEHQVKNIQAQFQKQANKALGGEYTKAELNCKGCMGPCGNCTDIVELEAIIRLGTEMRNAQKDYFKSRESAALKLSKELERSFDQRAAKKLAENVGGTFGNTKKTPVDLFS